MQPAFSFKLKNRSGDEAAQAPALPGSQKALAGHSIWQQAQGF